MPRPDTDWLAKWAHYTPGRMFLRDHARDLSWSYGDMNLRAAALAGELRGQGLGKGDRVAVFSRNRSETVLLLLACVKLGAVLVPLNFRLTRPELEVLVKDSQPSLVFGESELFESQGGPPELPDGARSLEMEWLTPFLEGEAPAADPAPAGPADPEDLVMILYTAGTTGLPKGAMITHRMLFWNSVNTSLRLDLRSTDHTQSYAPFFHTGGWNVLFTPFLHTGASHTLMESFDADLLLELMEKERTSLFFGVPTMLQMMADSPRFAAADLSSVRYAVVGGAPMPLPLIETWHEKGVAIRQGYGLTEVGPNCFSLHQDDAVRKRGSIGFPNFYVETRIVDEEGRDCGADERGELWLRSPVVTPGYWRKPEETAAAITDGWFHTGDIVRRDEEGFHYIVDRKKNMFISGGENVYPAEVEACLEQHPEVREAAVIGVADERWGEVGKAFVVAEAGREPPAEEVLAFCSGRLAKYKIPKHVEFIAELPRNSAGKIDRSKL